MSQALLTFLIAFCFLAQGYGANPNEEPCNDAESCRSLEEVKQAAYDVLNKAVGEGMMQLNKVKAEGEKIRKAVTDNTMASQMDKAAVRELMNISNEGNKAFEEALKTGKELPVFECIVECELTARRQFPAKVDQCKAEMRSLQKEPLAKTDATLQKVTQVETNLKATHEGYMKKIRDAYSNVGVTWNRDQALRAIAAVLKGSQNLGAELSGILEKYQESAQGVVKNCESHFVQLTEGAKECMKGCLE